MRGRLGARFGLWLVVASCSGCTAILDIDEEYTLASQAGTGGDSDSGPTGGAHSGSGGSSSTGGSDASTGGSATAGTGGDVGGAGAGGTGPGGTGPGGSAGAAGSGMGGTGGSGGAPACLPEQCPSCAGTPCCHSDGSCGCRYPFSPVCT